MSKLYKIQTGPKNVVVEMILYQEKDKGVSLNNSQNDKTIIYQSNNTLAKNGDLRQNNS